MRRSIFIMALLVAVLVPGWVLAGGDAAKGKQIYSQYCVACHGASGKGDGPVGAGLTPKPRDFTDKSVMNSYSDEHLFQVIKDGGTAVGKSPMMPPWGGALKAKDIRNVIAYIRGFSQ